MWEDREVLYKKTAHFATHPISHFSPSAMRALTARQHEILEFIRGHLRETGFPPTRVEICQALGFRSPNAAEDHLRALERKGVLQITPGASRGLRLLEPSPVEPPSPPSPAVALAQQVAESMGRLLQLPLIGRVAAGSPILAAAHIEQHFQVDPTFFAAPADYLLRVRGMSMRDIGILEGDLLAVQRLEGRGLEACRNGQIVVARLEDDVTVKRFSRRGHEVQLLPENPDFQPILVDLRRQELSIEGLAVGIVRSL